MIGSEALLSHVPELRARPRRLIAALIALASFSLASAAMIAIDVLWLRWTALGQMAGVIAGFFITARVSPEDD
ncbi:MAG: hypothetical protein AAB658_11165 [Chloroflexota bacterium]